MNEVSTPSSSSRASMVQMSLMRGTSCSTVLPGARSAAATNFSAAFLAPETSHLPAEPRPAFDVEPLRHGSPLVSAHSLPIHRPGPHNGTMRGSDYETVTARLCAVKPRGHDRAPQLVESTLDRACAPRAPGSPRSCCWRSISPLIHSSSSESIAELALGILRRGPRPRRRLSRPRGPPPRPGSGPGSRETLKKPSEVANTWLSSPWRIANVPDLHRGDRRRMVDHDPDVAVGDPGDDQVRLVVEDRPLRRDDPAEELPAVAVLILATVFGHR